MIVLCASREIPRCIAAMFLSVLTADWVALPAQAAGIERLLNVARPIASPEPDWPQWQGPRRDGISDEQGLLPSWPEGGPKLIWRTEGIGQGYSAPIIVRDRLYLAGEFDDDLGILALDLHGQKLWTATNGQAWKGPYPGARASCAYSDGRVYHMNSHGRIGCFDAETGRELWGFNMFERFGGKAPTWAVSENLLIDGSRVIITPGGSKALMAALDKTTGETIWTTEPLRLGPSPSHSQQRLAKPAGTVDPCGYASPVLFTLGKRRLIASCSLQHLFGVDADTGKLLWTQPFPTKYSVLPMAPVLLGEGLFITAPDTEEGGKWYRLLPDSSDLRVEIGWTTPLDTCHGGVVRVGDALYGSWYRKRKGWACIDARTGVVRYELNNIDQGPVLYADGRLYCLSQEGEMFLLRPERDRFDVSGRFRIVPGRKSDAWTHPVILNGRLYLRYAETLFCYQVRRAE